MFDKKKDKNKGLMAVLPEAILQHDLMELDCEKQFKAGYVACLEALVHELRDADGFTLRGMQPVVQALREKARRL